MSKNLTNTTMTTSEQIRPYGASTKRMTTWRGMQVGWNKTRSVYVEYTEMMTNSVSQLDASGGRVLMGRELQLTEIEQADLHATWLAGKKAWYEKTIIPLRANAERARQHLTSQQ